MQLENSILQYQAHLAYNRQVFLLNHGEMISEFTRIDHNFSRLRAIVSKSRDANNRTHVSMLPFISVMQRQALLAFDSLCTFQSYKAWVLLRPCVEAALIMGKWVEDPANAQIWADRQNNTEKHRKTFEGRYLQSRSLPSSSGIQQALKRINDDYMHTNLQYYSRHVSTRPDGGVSVDVEFFDTENEHQTNLYAVAHLLLVVQDSLLSMFQKLFAGLEKESMGLSEFNSAFVDKVRAFAGSDSDRLTRLSEFGLWVL